MAKDTDPVAEALAAKPPSTSGGQLRVDQLYGDRPKVLEEIRKARRDRKLGWDTIAAALTAAETDPSRSIGGSAIKSWCERQGIT